MDELESASILIIEDEPRLADFIVQSLQEAGARPSREMTLLAGEKEWRKARPDAVVLDLTLPDGDGLKLLEAARRSGDVTPVLILSAKSSLAERVSGFQSGADDYLPKPFGIEELLARLRVLLRRSRHTGRTPVRCDDLEIDLVSRRVTRAGRVVFLSETEYRLLEMLALAKGKPVSKEQILTKVWDDPLRDANVVEVYVSYLRQKLERGEAKRLVHTARGLGYVLAEEPDAY